MQIRFRFLLGLALGVLATSLAQAQAAKDFDERPMPVKSVAPIYPAKMKSERVSGVVLVKVVVDENGDVVERTISKSSRQEFEDSALDAVRQWKFKPAKKGGVAVKATVSIPIRFSMDEA